MSFTTPLFLLGLIPVVAVAVWALLRPARTLLVVASVGFWSEALASLDRSPRRSRRVTAAWALLLGGAVAAVLAASGPVWRRAAPVRRVAVVLHASAELAGDGGAQMRAAVDGLLDRLSGGDRVRLVRPAALGGATEWLSPAEAGERLASVSPLPVPAGALDVPAADGEAQHVYCFAVPGADFASGPDVSVVSLPAQLPPVVIEDFGAERLPDGSLRALVAVRNVSSQPWSGRVHLAAVDDGRRELAETRVAALAPAVRAERTIDVPAANDGIAPAGLIAELRDGGEPLTGPGAAGFLAAAPGEPRRVLLTGRDEPLLRRFVTAHDGLELVADAARAQLVITNAPRAPLSGDLPALVIDPARAAGPAGWRRAEPQRNVALSDAHVAPTALTEGVSLDGVAVRRVRPWVAAGSGARAAQALLRIDAGALVIRRDAADQRAARVYVAFDLSEANTNFATYPSFVVFLARALDELVPPRRRQYAAVSPSEASGDDWQPVA
ncbi:MAG: hypothetical protein ACOC8F_08045, partial [Planctomycetota bacterium]